MIRANKTHASGSGGAKRLSPLSQHQQTDALTSAAKPMAKFSQELFDAMCERIMDGESLRGVCRDPEMPATSTFMKWVLNDSVLAEQYARAKDESAEADADDVKDVANRVLEGEIDPQAARVAIDAFKWAAGKKKPKKYGDKIDVTSDGERLAAPSAIMFEVYDPKER